LAASRGLTDRILPMTPNRLGLSSAVPLLCVSIESLFEFKDEKLLLLCFRD